MVDVIFQEFEADLDSFESLLSLVQCNADFMSEREIAAGDIPEEFAESIPGAVHAFIDKANVINRQVRLAHAGIPQVRGALLLISIARFEAFVRSEIEDLALRASMIAGNFSALPSKMRESLRKISGDVIADPKKYRMEKHVAGIANVLARNLSDQSNAGEINKHCISITTENMWADTVTELFMRLGLQGIWDNFGASTEIKIFFETHDQAKAAAECKTQLNKLIELRNKIAHTPHSVTWPSHPDTERGIKFIRLLGKALSANVPVFEIKLKTMIQNPAG